MTHAEYCHNRMARINASSFIFGDGIEIFLINGEYLTKNEVAEKYPITGKLITWKQKKHNKGSNPNKKTSSVE